MFDALTKNLSHAQEGCTLDFDRNRHLQLDVDGVAYHVAKPQTSLDSNVKGCINYVNVIRMAAGAGQVNTHTTLKLKGGREHMAYYAVYQEKRHGYQDPAYMQRVRDIREALIGVETEVIKPCPQMFVEADDSMTQMHLAHIQLTGDPYSSIIGSDDKDLGINPGNIMNIKTKKTDWCGKWDYETKAWADVLGWCAYRAPSGSKNKKLLGRGRRFFWAQMLAGDTADNIKGVPTLPAEFLDLYEPLKQGRKRMAGSKKVCGSSFAARAIMSCSSELACYELVLQAYRACFGEHGDFFMFENAFLLWMRRTPDPLDCLEYMRSFGFNYQLHPQQQTALDTYYQECYKIMETM